MKKYFQIVTVLGVFGLLVIVRQHVGAEDTVPAVIAPKSQTVIIPTQTLTPTSSQSPSQVSTKQTTGTSAVASPTPMPAGQYKDGTYTGSVADAFYGNIQVQAIISGGKITDVIFLQFPNDNGTSQYINSQADPMLKQEALVVQSANVNIISGASASSQAFQQSLADALTQAK